MIKELSGRESNRLSARLKSSGSLAPRPQEEATQAQTMNIIAGNFLTITFHKHVVIRWLVQSAFA